MMMPLEGQLYRKEPVALSTLPLAPQFSSASCGGLRQGNAGQARHSRTIQIAR